MDEKTLTALQGSIAKWEAIVNGTGFDDGPENCPLCKEFIFIMADEPAWAQDGCYGCPVAHTVGLEGCRNTPYVPWSKHHHAFNGAERKVFDVKSRELAQAELDFLESLLPSSSSAAGDGKESK